METILKQITETKNQAELRALYVALSRACSEARKAGRK